MPYKRSGISPQPGPQHFNLWRSGSYYFTAGSFAASTSGGLGNGVLRVSPWYVPTPVSITRIGAEFTVAGSDAASVFRIGVYADDGTGTPTGPALLDAGSISTGTGNAGTVATGGTPGNYEITVAATFAPGLYWVGGVVQAAPGTQPTLRTVASGVAPVSAGTSIPAAGQVTVALSLAGVTGALPTWSGVAVAGSVARIFIKTA